MSTPAAERGVGMNSKLYPGNEGLNLTKFEFVLTLASVTPITLGKPSSLNK